LQELQAQKGAVAQIEQLGQQMIERRMIGLAELGGRRDASLSPDPVDDLDVIVVVTGVLEEKDEKAKSEAQIKTILKISPSSA
jgi:hypothetical protein